MDPSKPYDAGPPPPPGVPAPGQEYNTTPPPPPYVAPTIDYNSGAAPPAHAYAPQCSGHMQPPYVPQGSGHMQQPPYAAAPAPMGMQAPPGVPPGAPPSQVYVQPVPGQVYAQPAQMPPGTMPAPQLGPDGKPLPVVFATKVGPDGKIGFTTGLCDCCEGPGGPVGCLIAWLVPCWAHGIIGDVVADGVGRVPPCALTLGLYALAYIGNCFWRACYPYNLIIELPAAVGFIVVSVFGRKKMREKYGIPGNACPGDCCTVYWCHCCSLAQEMRHIRDHMPNRDFELLENREARRTDLDFLKRATAPYF